MEKLGLSPIKPPEGEIIKGDCRRLALRRPRPTTSLNNLVLLVDDYLKPRVQVLVASAEKRICDERSNEWKVVSYVSSEYSALAVATLQPSFAPRSASPISSPI